MWLAGRGPRRVRTTVADATTELPVDLVDWNFAVSTPNRLWVVDARVRADVDCDGFHRGRCRRIVGWHTASRIPTELPLDALEMGP